MKIIERIYVYILYHKCNLSINYQDEWPKCPCMMWDWELMWLSWLLIEWYDHDDNDPKPQHKVHKC